MSDQPIRGIGQTSHRAQHSGSTGAGARIAHSLSLALCSCPPVGGQTFEQLLAREMAGSGAGGIRGVPRGVLASASTADANRPPRSNGRVHFPDEQQQQQEEEDEHDDRSEQPHSSNNGSSNRYPQPTSFASQFQAVNEQLAQHDDEDDSGYNPYAQPSSQFEDGAHDEQEISYNEHEQEDEGEGDYAASSRFQTSFPLPSLNRTHPLSPLKESSQELDSARLREIRDSHEADDDDDDGGAGDHDGEEHPMGDELQTASDGEADDHEEFQTAIYSPSPVVAETKEQQRRQSGGSNTSMRELEEFQRLEAEAQAQIEQEQYAAAQSSTAAGKKLRPSHTQLNNSLTRQQMQQLEQEERQAQSYSSGYSHSRSSAPAPAPSAAAAVAVFDDDEEWTEPARPATRPSSSSSAAPAARPSASAGPSSTHNSRSHRPSHDDLDDPDREDEYSSATEAYSTIPHSYSQSEEEEDGYEQGHYTQQSQPPRRDPLSMAQVIPPRSSFGAGSAPAPAPASGSDAPPQSSMVKKFFKPATAAAGAGAAAARPSSAPAHRKPAAAAASSAGKPGSNKKKPSGASASTAAEKSSPAPAGSDAKSLALEVDRYHKETLKLKRLAKEQESELAFLRAESVAARAKLQAEREEFERQKEEEAKRQRNAKVALEKERRSLSGAPDRREREQIDSLLARVAQLEADLQSAHEKSRAADQRSKREKDLLNETIRSLKSEMAQAESKRIDEWEARKHEFIAQIEVQRRREKEAEAQAAAAQAKKRQQAEAAHAAPPAAGSGYAPATSVGRVSGAPHVTPSTGAAAAYNRAPLTGSAAAAPSAAANAFQSFPQQPQQQPLQAFSSAAAPAASPPPPPAPAPFPVLRAPASSRSLLNRGAPLSSLTVVREVAHAGGKSERFLSDGSRLILFRNDTTKRIFPDGFVVVSFPNGDAKQTEIDGRVIYFYASADTTHTTFPDGVQLYEFAGSNQIERHYPDGRKEIHFADGTIKQIEVDGTEISRFPDGTVHRAPPAGGQQPQQQQPPQGSQGAGAGAYSHPFPRHLR